MSEPIAVHAERLVKPTATWTRCAGSTCGSSAARCSASSGPTAPGSRLPWKMPATLLSIKDATAHVAGVDIAREPDAARHRIRAALYEARLAQRQTGRERLSYANRIDCPDVPQFAGERTGRNPAGGRAGFVTPMRRVPTCRGPRSGGGDAPEISTGGGISFKRRRPAGTHRRKRSYCRRPLKKSGA